MGTKDPRPESWRDRHVYELITRRKVWSGNTSANCTCGWGQTFPTREMAEGAWAKHARGTIQSAWRKHGWFTRPLSEHWSGEPDAPG